MSKARTNKRGSLNHQINLRMQSMERMGESRHKAKQEAREMGYKHNRTVGMHSIKTYGTYKSTTKQFVLWTKDTGQSIKNIEDVKEEHIREFIKDRYEDGYSPYTCTKDMSALNKIFNTNVTKKECGVPNRSYKDITNNRDMKEHHKHINYNNYKNEITIIQATGIRRSNLEKITPNTFNFKADGTPYQIRLQDERKYGGDNWTEKGGKSRIVDIPEQLQERVKEIIEEHRNNGYEDNKPLFQNVSKKLGTHRFRQEFAKTVYNGYIEKYGVGTMTLEKAEPKYEGKETTEFRGYDVGALKYTTQQLGHNRLDIVIYNYFNK